MRAVFDKVLTETPKCTQYLWRVIPAEGESTPATHVATSSLRFLRVRETAAFWSDKDGEVTSWEALSRTEPDEHVACLEIAGIEVVQGD